MKYPINTTAIIDVTKPPYCADNTGCEDCTKILIKILDDILIRQVDALQETHDRLIELSDNKKEDVYIGIEGGRVQNGKLSLTFPEHEPSSKIIYFPKGVYKVSDTITYSLDNLKGFWYWVPGFENCRNIHFLGESREDTVILLSDNSKGFESGNSKPLISFCNNELQVPRHEEFTNVAFMNTIEDITLDCGKGNPGAIGIKYVSSNCGRIENVTIKTEQGECGVYVANNTSQGVFTNIAVSGFDYGMDIENSNIIALDDIDVSSTKIAGFYTNSSNLLIYNIISGDIPTFQFKESHERKASGRYYFTNSNITFANENPGNSLYFEDSSVKRKKIPVNNRSANPDDWAFVDDYGAVGDGITDSSTAIQKAMNSGKSIVVFGEGEYLINKKIKIPKTVKTVDFLFCSLASGIRLVGGEYDAAFEISEDSNNLLFIENLSAWENFKGHIRLVKHAAKRDVVLSDIHLMTASMYFNSIPGSHVYIDNCFLTTGTYTVTAWIPGNGFSPAYCHILPYEFHGQKVYGRQINPERADIAMLNDNSEILLDGFRTEGQGTALKSINSGKTIINIFNAGLGCKEAQNPVFDLYDSDFSIFGALIFGASKTSEYNKLIQDKKNNTSKLITWDDVNKDENVHFVLLDYNN